jgi:hypothetical protein
MRLAARQMSISGITGTDKSVGFFYSIKKADPVMTVEWQPGHRVVYVKNPDYVPRAEPPDNLAGGKVAKVDRVERR